MKRNAGITWLPLCLLLGGPLCAVVRQDGPPPASVVFIKEFPGSSPAYYAVTVHEDGTVAYATAPDDPQPLSFRLSEPLTSQVFQTIARLGYLKGAQLETKKRVASMGKKTLRYESGEQRDEASFNYSENPDAMALAGLFERISITEQHLINLERTVRFDRLGVVKQLLQIEISMNKKELVEPSQFIPLLERVANNASFMHMARQRANGLLARIRSQPNTATLEPERAR